MEIQSRLTIEDLSGLLNKDFWAVKKAYQRGKYSTAIKIDGRITIDINDQAIPAEARIKYYSAQNSSLPVVQPASAISPRKTKAEELTEKQSKVALAKAALLDIYQKTISAAPRKELLKVKTRFETGYNNGSLRDIFSVLGTRDWKTLDKWLKLYIESEYDYTVLAPRYKAPKPTITFEEIGFLLDHWLTQNKPKISDAIFWAKEEMTARGIENIKSDITYRRWMEGWKAKHYEVYVARREGEKALNDKCLPWIPRDAGELKVGDCLIADGHKLDFELINPHTGKPARMTLILFYDWASNMPVGWEIMPTENIKAIAIALRRAIKFLGRMPKVIYLDNGRAFSAKYFNGIDFRQTIIPGLFKRLGIKTVFAWPYHGQSKPVERFFGSFGQLERLMVTYIGNCINNKPAHLNRGEKITRKLYDTYVDMSQFTLFAGHQAVAWWCWKIYANKVQQDGHLKGLKPIDVFREGKGPGVDERELLFLMMEEHFTVPRNCKIIIPKLGTYYSRELFGLKEEVKVKYDFIEKDWVYIYDKKTGDFICAAETERMAHPLAWHLGDEEDQAYLKERFAERGEMKKEVMDEVKDNLKNIYLLETQRYLESEGILTPDDPLRTEPVRQEKIKTDKKQQNKSVIESGKKLLELQQQEEEDEEILRFSFQKKAAVK
jgi:putative transposase